MAVSKDQVLDLLLAALQVVKVVLVMCHNLPDPIHELVSLFKIERLEDKTEPDLTLSTLLLALDELDQRRVDVREGLEDDGFHGERSALLLEVIPTLFVRVLKEVKGRLGVEWVEQSLISELNPINHLRQVLFGLTKELVEGELGKQRVQVLEEQGQLVLQCLFVEVNHGLGE